jgi:hypothetical protein
MDFPNARIMIYGYKSNLIGEVDSDRLSTVDYTRDLIQQLENARCSNNEKVITSVSLRKEGIADIHQGKRASAHFHWPQYGRHLDNTGKSLFRVCHVSDSTSEPSNVDNAGALWEY